jgi:hypothetical protein
MQMLTYIASKYQVKDENAKTMDNVLALEKDRRTQQQLLTQLNEK